MRKLAGSQLTGVFRTGAVCRSGTGVPPVITRKMRVPRSNCTSTKQEMWPVCAVRDPERRSATAGKLRKSPMRNCFSVVALLTLLSLNVIPALAQTPAQPTASETATVERRVESLLNKMTLEEKIDMLGGVD